VSSPRRRTLTGLGVGLVAAGATAAAGVATDRLLRARSTAKALDGTDSYDVVADEELVVLADDGVPLHVEIDRPKANPSVQDVVPTVVFSHGYTLSLRSWVFQRRALTEAGYRVVVWDQRGHGRSGLGSRESANIDQLGRDLARVIAEAAPKGPLVLVGHSMGGMTMMSLAVDHHLLIRERVIAAAFIATSPGNLDEVSWGLGNMLGKVVHRFGPLAVGQLATRQALVTSVLKAGKDVEEFFVDRYSFASPVPLSIVRLTADMIFGTRMEVMAHFMVTFDSHDKREALEQFNGVETLVLNGMQDLLTPPAHSEEIVRLIPGAEHVIVNDAGHIIMLEHPDTVSQQLLSLIQRGSRARSEEERRARTAGVRRTVTDLAQQRRVATARPGRRRHVS
jgi:pimeloyl-ACP methyl ester carboxylesterase